MSSLQTHTPKAKDLRSSCSAAGGAPFDTGSVPALRRTLTSWRPSHPATSGSVHEDSSRERARRGVVAARLQGVGRGPARQQQGWALILAVLVLLMSTVIALGAVRGAVVQERLAANTNAHAAARFAADDGLARLHESLLASWRPADKTWTENTSAASPAWPGYC